MQIITNTSYNNWYIPLPSKPSKVNKAALSFDIEELEREDPSTFLEVSEQEVDETMKWIEQLKSSKNKVRTATKDLLCPNAPRVTFQVKRKDSPEGEPTPPSKKAKLEESRDSEGIVENFKPVERVLPTEISGEDILAVRFSQLSITNQRPNEFLAAFPHPNVYSKSIKLYDVIRTQGWDERSKLLVVDMPDKQYTSFDNRRLAVAKTVYEVSHSILIKVDAHRHNESLSEQFFKTRFQRMLHLNQPLNRSIGYQTYGHAIETRLIQSSRINAEIFSRFKYGFTEMPLVSLGVEAGEEMGKILVVNGQLHFQKVD